MNRRPRILLVSEFYPANPDTCVFGAFKRLRCHVEALSRLGTVDAVFFWPQHDMSAEMTGKQVAQTRKSWPIEGSIRFIKAATGPRSKLEWLTDVLWAVRGAVGFFHTKATMRTCRRTQVVALQRCIDELMPDLIFAHRLGGFAPLMRMQTDLPPIVVDVDDLEHVKLARLARTIPHPARKAGLMAQTLLALHALRRASGKARHLLVTSELDREKIRSACTGFDATLIANSASRFAAIRSDPGPVACFVGTAAYPPNAEAILWFVREVWPLVRKAVPDARLLIAGENTERLVPDGAGQAIEALGFVADLAAIYDRARLCVCPVRRGAGTRIKIIEAAMNGRPAVSTTVGAEGLRFTPDEEILLADKAADFAQACVRLLRDANCAAALGGAARRRAEAEHSEESIAHRLQSLCSELIAASGAGSTPIQDEQRSRLQRLVATPRPAIQSNRGGQRASQSLHTGGQHVALGRLDQAEADATSRRTSTSCRIARKGHEDRA